VIIVLVALYVLTAMKMLLVKPNMKRKTDLLVACVIDSDTVRKIKAGKTSETGAKYDLSVLETLRGLYRDVRVVSATEGTVRTLDELWRLKPDVVFNLAFSILPLEASFAGCLDVLGLPYTGSGPRGITLANDKVRSRQLLRNAGIRVPRFIELRAAHRILGDLAFPVIVKPSCLASSAGIYSDSLAKTPQEIVTRARRIWGRFGVSAICEEFVVGRELRVGLVEAKRGSIRIVGTSEWLFGSASPGWGFKTQAIRNNPRVRRSNQVTRKLITLPRRKAEELAAIARVSMNTLDVTGYATVDVRVDTMERVTVLEVNANPGLWSGSAIWSKPSFEINIKEVVEAALRKPRN
jgi:D-alanine-D-alanine ligase